MTTTNSSLEGEARDLDRIIRKISEYKDLKEIVEHIENLSLEDIEQLTREIDKRYNKTLNEIEKLIKKKDHIKKLTNYTFYIGISSIPAMMGGTFGALLRFPPNSTLYWLITGIAIPIFTVSYFLLDDMEKNMGKIEAEIHNKRNEVARYSLLKNILMTYKDQKSLSLSNEQDTMFYK